MKISPASQSVSSFQAALAWNLGPTLERVPSLCPTRQGNSLWRGMEGTLGSRALSTPLKVRGLTVLSQVRGLRTAWAEKLFSLHKGSSFAVLCVYTLQLNWFQAVCLYNVHTVQPNWFSFSLAQAKANTLYLSWTRQNVVFNYSSF